MPGCFTKRVKFWKPSAKIVFNLTEFTLFNADPKRHNCPSASCASAAIAISTDRRIFNGGFFLNNQPDALIIKIYSVIKLHVSGILSARHQEFSTVHSALVSFMQVSDGTS